MFRYLIILLIAVTSVASAQTYSGPESVEFDSRNNRWLISNTQSHEILSRDSNGVVTVFAGNISSGPYGIEVVGDTLFACCGSNITGFLLSDGSVVFNVNVGATFLNGIAHDNSGNLITTDFSAKTIHKLSITTQTDTIIASALPQSPNGIVYDNANSRCIFVNWGNNAPVKAIDMNTFVVTTVVNTSLGNCDGIAVDGRGNYYISNWSSQSVVRYDSSFLSGPVTVVSNLSHPADIYYNISDDTLVIPNASDNTVDFIGFGSVTAVNPVKATNNFVYPNPFADNLQLKTLNVSANPCFELIDMTGRKTILIPSKNEQGIFVFELNYIPPGIYIMNEFEGQKLRAKHRLCKQ